MKFTEEEKKEILKQYLQYVDETSDLIEWKTYFGPQEIVYQVIKIIEEMANAD